VHGVLCKNIVATKIQPIHASCSIEGSQSI